MPGHNFVALPEAVVHDHIDGGIRPLTLLALAAQAGYDRLPAFGEEGLAAWLHKEDAPDLVAYLRAFEHTIAVLQSPDALRRVTRECVADLARDGVIYSEVRFAPSLHIRKDMPREGAIEAVSDGLASGSAETPDSQSALLRLPSDHTMRPWTSREPTPTS
jgi:adenosine deaminase